MIRYIIPIISISVLLNLHKETCAQNTVPDDIMEKIYQEIKTPYKYGLVLAPDDTTQMVDCPSIFRHNDKWYMIYIVFEGTGYETYLAQSSDLLHWVKLKRILSFSEGTWDSHQKAGYIALQDYSWGGSYELQQYNGKYWLTYLGGAEKGYESGKLAVGLAYTSDLEFSEVKRLQYPVLSSNDVDVRWYDNETIFKSTLIWVKENSTGFPFIMFYNARGSCVTKNHPQAERIAMAVSNDLINWKRYGDQPIIDHGSGISGDPFITKIGDIWVMFYFGAFWKPGAFNRFACSYNLVDWTIWKGDDLISPSEVFDSKYAHKSFVIKYDNVVYHYYCAVDRNGNRGIALATSVNKGKSSITFKK